MHTRKAWDWSNKGFFDDQCAKSRYLSCWGCENPKIYTTLYFSVQKSPKARRTSHLDARVNKGSGRKHL